MLAVACLLTGCGLTPRSAAPTTAASTAAAPTAAATITAATTAAAAQPSPSATQLARVQRTHELPSPARPPQVAGGWRSPAQAVQYFTAYYVNWTAQTVPAHLRALARVSVGQARATLSIQAQQTAHDDELRRGGIANSGVVEAIAPVVGRSDVYAVVTRERTTATNSSAYQGLAPSWHVSLATVTRVRGLWVLSAWQPEN
jgi:hypothetical protein